MPEMKKKTKHTQPFSFFPFIHTTDTDLSLKLNYLPVSILKVFLLLKLIYENFFQLVSMILRSTPFMMPVLLEKFAAAYRKLELTVFFNIFSLKDYHKLSHTGSLREKTVSLFSECIFNLNLLSFKSRNKMFEYLNKVLVSTYKGLELLIFRLKPNYILFSLYMHKGKYPDEDTC